MTESAALAAQIRSGDRRALARGLTVSERGGPAALALRQALGVPPHGRVVGITGAPGAGKSTLTTVLAAELRRRGLLVGILAVDPSSPLSGGSILGDRIRMYDLAGDSGVFIRSMANRGRFGGIAATTSDACALLACAGFDIVLLETVGAGQSDVAVAEVAETVLLVEAPGMGDEVQSIKAGLLEVADVIAVSKADRPDAALTLQQLRALVHMQTDTPDAWVTPVCGVSALQGSGIDALVDALLAHHTWVVAHPLAGRFVFRRQSALRRAVEVRLLERLAASAAWQQALAQCTTDRGVDIEALADQLLNTPS